MLRGWTLAAVGISTLFATTATAQPAAGVSLAERLGLSAGPHESEAPSARPMYDPNVRPAAVAAEDGPRSPRETALKPPKRKPSGGGLFSHIKLPSLMPGSSTQEQLADPPMAYDPSESAVPRNAAPRGTTQSQTQTQARTQASQGARTPGRSPAATAATPQRRTTTAPGTTAAAPARMATPRVARSSPRNDNRHNELADALTGLRDATAAEESQNMTGSGTPADDTVASEGSIDVTPPAADGGEEAPSYMNDEAGSAGTTGAATRGSTAAGSTTRGSARGPVDVRDALLGNESAPTGNSTTTTTPRATAAAPTTKTTTSPAPTSTAVRRTPPASNPVITPAARRATTQSTAPARRSPPLTPIVEADAAADLRTDVASAPNRSAAPATPSDSVDNPGEALGGIVAEPTPPAFEATPTTPAPPTATPTRTSAPITRSETVGPVVKGIGNLRPKREVLLSCKVPVIVSSVSGPQRIVVGRTAEYKVMLENKGDETARDMVATIVVPNGADVLDAAASNGAVDQPSSTSDSTTHTVQWRLYELGAGASQTLTLQLIPRSGRTMQLAVKCEQAPSMAEATVEVQEPKLQMNITGPAEVVFGKSQRYSLTLANPGSGNADDVVIELVPPGGDPKSPVKHKVGALAAGASKTIELELTAREAGDLKMLASAVAAGDLHAEAVKTVVCRKAELDVDWRGPEKNFAGAVATYYIRVRNPGTAAADKVAVEVSLPPGVELIDASAGHSWDANRHLVVWQPGAIGSNEERFMQLQCKLSKPGVNQMELVARTEAGDLSDVQSVPVTVEALADLKLQVSDPEGVLPVGQTGLYEIHVQNRGKTAAHGVNVVAMFSEGVDPSHVEGGQHDIRDGRVAFRTIDSLPAGAEVVLRIHAKATQPGTHVFRTEVVCDDLETKLVAEETTRFFVEEERWADASSAYSDKGDATTR